MHPTVSERHDDDDEPSIGSTLPPKPGAFQISGPAPVYIPADEESFLWEDPPPRHVEAPTSAGHTGIDASTETLFENEHRGMVVDAQVAEVVEKVPDEEEIASNWKGMRCRVIAAVVVVLIIAVVVAVVVAAGGGSDNKKALTPQPTTLAPTASPILTPPSAKPVGLFDECFSTTRSLSTALLSRRSPYEFVDIELCRGQFYVDLGIEFNAPWVGLRPAIIAQSNMRVRCGDNGLLENQCVVGGTGEALVLNIWSSVFREDEHKNVTFEGITFQRGSNALIRMSNGGDITFKNCLFRVSIGI